MGRVVQQWADSGFKAATDRKRKLAGVTRNREMKGGRGFAAAAAASVVLQRQGTSSDRPRADTGEKVKSETSGVGCEDWQTHVHQLHVTFGSFLAAVECFQAERQCF